MSPSMSDRCHLLASLHVVQVWPGLTMDMILSPAQHLIDNWNIDSATSIKTSIFAGVAIERVVCASLCKLHGCTTFAGADDQNSGSSRHQSTGNSRRHQVHRVTKSCLLKSTPRLQLLTPRFATPIGRYVRKLWICDTKSTSVGLFHRLNFLSYTSLWSAKAVDPLC